MKTIKWLAGIFSILLMIIIFVLILSPYQSNSIYSHRAIVEKVVIKANVDQVYQYLGNSDNAKVWSTYVDHITTLNPTEFKDGEKGSKRRCFKNANEKGPIWDEEILINDPNQRRRLSIYDMKNFRLQADHLRTEQIYRSNEEGNCELYFTLFFKDGERTWWRELKLYLASFKVSSIFKANLEKIKIINEKNTNMDM